MLTTYSLKRSHDSYLIQVRDDTTALKLGIDVSVEHHLGVKCGLFCGPVHKLLASNYHTLAGDQLEANRKRKRETHGGKSAHTREADVNKGTRSKPASHFYQVQTSRNSINDTLRACRLEQEFFPGLNHTSAATTRTAWAPDEPQIMVRQEPPYSTYG